MNERLKALRVQAINYCLDNPTDDENLRSLSERVAYKFAELIIRECADIATINQYEAFSSGYYVKKHFGIENT